MIRERKVVGDGVTPTPTPAEWTQAGGGGGGGWWGQRSMMDAPPLPLVALFGIVLFYLYVSTYLPFKEDLHRGFYFLKLLFFLLLPTLLFFLVRSNYNYTAEESGVSGTSSSSPRRWYHIRTRRPGPGPEPVPVVGGTIITTTS